MENSELLPKLAQPSGGGFIAVDKILKDLTDRNGLRQVWESIDRDTQTDIKHQWALFVTEVLDMQALVIKSRTQPRVTVETPWTCAGHGDNFNDGCTECEWVAICNRYEETIAKLEAQPRLTVEEVALWLYNRYEPHPVGWQNQTEMVRQTYLSDAQALKAAHPHLFKE